MGRNGINTAGSSSSRAHYHVHSTLGSGYLCECDSHAVLRTVRERDTALRYERDTWREYCADGADWNDYRITGSVRAGWFDIDDRASLGWSRVVRSWSCTDAECSALED